MTQQKLGTQPYKGTRDFFPEEKRLQKYMFNKLRTVAEKYGYEEYDAPILEPEELYLAKTGAEIVNEQTYVFEDRGKRKVVIRPEMTPSVSRMVAAKRQELGYPLRWYSLPNLWRYERPQKGRLREHWQLNVDIFGVKGVEAETELVTLIDDAFASFGATRDMYEIRINSRELINYMLNDYLELDEKQAYATSKLIDRINKMPRDKFVAELDTVFGADAKASGKTEQLLAILAATTISDLPEAIQQQASTQDLASMLQQLKAAGISNALFDITIMRGFDYYTGIVFEVTDTNPDNNRSMLGGGRYDGLVGLFGVDPVPTVGFGWGDVTLEEFLKSHRLLPTLQPETDVYIVLAGVSPGQVQPVAQQLRQQGLNVAVDLSGRKLGDQFKTADKKGITTALIVGESELASGTYKIKNLVSGDEQLLPIDSVAESLRNARN